MFDRVYIPTALSDVLKQDYDELTTFSAPSAFVGYEEGQLVKQIPTQENQNKLINAHYELITFFQNEKVIVKGLRPESWKLFGNIYRIEELVMC